MYEVPRSKASKGQDMFPFTIDGEAFKVKRLMYLSLGQLEELEESTAALDFFGKKGTKQGTAIRGLTKPEFEALVNAWRADSESQPGESQAS